MFVVPCFGFGGLERVVISILESLDRFKFNPSFCSLIKPEPALFDKIEKLGLPCHVLDKGEGVSLSLPFRLSRVFRSENVQLVNSHDIGATLYAAPAGRLAGVRGVIHTDHSQILAKSKFLGVYGWLLRNLVAHSITVSSDLEDHLVGKYGVRPGRVTIIPNGIDTSVFSGERDTGRLRMELGIGESDAVIGSVGRLTLQKGVEYLLKAFEMVLERNRAVKLVIVGEGELRGELESLALELGIRDRVVFTGIRQDIPDLLALFDVFALASLWEGQPITIMEAMAAGKPIAVTDVGGNAEILEHGRSGMIVPARDPETLAESLGILLDDRRAAEALGESARDYAEKNLSSAAMVEKYEAVYESIP
jgi:glycosyltransferase involved in cell wall biosynthesis